MDTLSVSSLLSNECCLFFVLQSMVHCFGSDNENDTECNNSIGFFVPLFNLLLEFRGIVSKCVGVKIQREDCRSQILKI